MINLIKEEIQEISDGLNKCKGYLDVLDVDLERARQEHNILKKIVHLVVNHTSARESLITESLLEMINEAQTILKNS